MYGAHVYTRSIRYLNKIKREENIQIYYYLQGINFVMCTLIYHSEIAQLG